MHRGVAIPGCNVLIHCGDFCSFQQDDLQTLQDVDAWFGEVEADHVICIGGNHDFALQSGKFRFINAAFLEDRVIEAAGLAIYGSPWCPDLPGFAYFASHEELIEHWKRIPTDIDILVTHTPPYRILDLPTSGNVHLGCQHLLQELNRVRPRLHVFGHVHASHGVFENGTTRFINAAVVGGQPFTLRHGASTAKLQPRSNNGIEKTLLR